MTRHATIQHIPVEVLLEVFHIDLLDSRDKISKYYKDVLRLMLVCKAWHVLIMDTPAFWSLIHCFDPAYEKLLARSKNAPLEIFHTDDNEPVRMDVIEKLLEHVHRWETVRLNLDGTSEENVRFCHALHFATEKSLAELHDVSSGPPSPLRRLELSGAKLKAKIKDFTLGDWTRVSGLRHLALDYLHAVDTTVSQLLEVLGNCPDMRTLRIMYSTFQSDPIITCDDRPIIDLPRLHYLGLFTWSSSISQILRSISTPNWTTFVCNVWDGSGTPWVFSLNRPSELLRRRTSQSRKLWDPSYEPTRNALLTQTLVTRMPLMKEAMEVVLGHTSLSLKMLGESKRDRDHWAVSYIDVDSADVGRLYVDWLLPLIETHIDPTIGITLHVNDNLLHEDSELFQSLPRSLARVVTLRLPCMPSVETLLGELSSPRVEEGWICPKMQGLKVMCGYDVGGEMVLEMVKARSQARLEEMSQDCSCHPPPEGLSWITVETTGEEEPPIGMDDLTFEAIRSIVGPRAKWIDGFAERRLSGLASDSDSDSDETTLSDD